MVDTEVLLDGEELILCTLVVNNKCLLRDFIESLDENNKKQVISSE